MKVLLKLFLLISSSFPQDIFVQNEEKNLYRSAVEYSFDEVLDNGAYTFTMTEYNIPDSVKQAANAPDDFLIEIFFLSLSWYTLI